MMKNQGLVSQTKEGLRYFLKENVFHRLNLTMRKSKDEGLLFLIQLRGKLELRILSLERYQKFYKYLK